MKKSKEFCPFFKMDSHRDLTTVSHFLRQKSSALRFSLVLLLFQARNVTCDVASRGSTQRLLALTGEIVMTTKFIIPALVTVSLSSMRLWLSASPLAA